MFDAKKLLEQLLGAQVPGTSGTVKDSATQVGRLAKDNPLATGALAAVLLGTGTGRQLASSTLKLGGLAAIAGLGYQAYKKWQANTANETAQSPITTTTEALPPPAGSGFALNDPTHDADFVVSLIRAMIAAARADGSIDQSERDAILGRATSAGLGNDAEAFLESELSKPVDIDSIISAAKTESQRVELFTASRITIDPNTRAERGYLDLLAGRLGLADALIDHIEATVTAAKK